MEFFSIFTKSKSGHDMLNIIITKIMFFFMSILDMGQFIRLICVSYCYDSNNNNGLSYNELFEKVVCNNFAYFFIRILFSPVILAFLFLNEKYDEMLEINPYIYYLILVQSIIYTIIFSIYIMILLFFSIVNCIYNENNGNDDNNEEEMIIIDDDIENNIDNSVMVGSYQSVDISSISGNSKNNIIVSDEEISSI
jgi:hypothetical protein